MLLVSLLAVVGAAGAAQWTTLDQATLSSVGSVHPSPDGRWACFDTTGTQGTRGNLTSTLATVLVDLSSAADDDNGSKRSSGAEWPGCTCVGFAPNSASVGLISGGALLVSTLGGDGAWSKPAAVSPAGRTVLAARFAPNSSSVAVSVAAVAEPSPSLSWDIEDEVIIDVITKVPTAKGNELYVIDLGTPGSFRHVPTAGGSVGFGGWYVSCWPQDSQFDWKPDGSAIVYSYTSSTLSNNWTQAGVAVVTLSGEGHTTTIADETQTAFQPMHSPDGTMIAYTKTDSDGYTWAQTWRVCVWSARTAGGPTPCSPVMNGTADQMPTLVGWHGNSELLYMEQVSTSVALFSLSVAQGVPRGWRRVDLAFPAPFVSGGAGVVGGGFRSTSRVSVVSAAAGGGTRLGLSFEQPTVSQQAFVAELAAGAAALAGPVAARQISRVNPQTEGHTFVEQRVVSWPSDDGLVVEGILMLPPGLSAAELALAPAVVFTHCGPAMSVLATFEGYGSVCARFPLETLAEVGYVVLAPNYRGSTGRGAAFRRADRFDWGGSDYNDVMTGALWLVKQGYASPQRISHIGWSYGGYMSALAMGTSMTTHGVRLNAVVTGGTLSDLISHTGTTDISAIIGSWAGGFHWTSPTLRSKMEQHSGIYHIENATAPTLMFHGVDDPRMPISQSFQLHYALKQRGVPVRFVAFPGSGHIPGDPNQILVVWDECVAWLQKWSA